LIVAAPSASMSTDAVPKFTTTAHVRFYSVFQCSSCIPCCFPFSSATPCSAEFFRFFSVNVVLTLLHRLVPSRNDPNHQRSESSICMATVIPSAQVREAQIGRQVRAEAEAAATPQPTALARKRRKKEVCLLTQVQEMPIRRFIQQMRMPV
jgi:hypothetical protein